MSTKELTAELTTHGYIKTHYKHDMPLELLNLIRNFYDLFYHWHFKHDKLTEFRTSKRGYELQSYPFTIRDITFQLLLYPNGTEQGTVNDKSGYVRYFLYIDSVPNDIDYFGVYCKLSCEQTGTEFEFFERFNHSDDYWGWLYPLKLSECQTYKHLCFDCFADIKHIKYVTESEKSDFVQVAPIHKSVAFEWKIDTFILDKLSKGETVEKDKNEKQWRPCLFTDEDGELLIGVDFMQFPFDIWSIDTEINVTNDINNGKISEITNNNDEGFEEITTGVSLEEIVSGLVTFTVSLEIVSMYDRQYRCIDGEEWHKYGIEML